MINRLCSWFLRAIFSAGSFSVPTVVCSAAAFSLAVVWTSTAAIRADDDLSRPAQASADGLRFFEAKVRPLLVEHCSECHGKEKQKGDLRLDSLPALLVGGESGPAIVPSEPEKSLLIEAVRYESLEMPPAGKLDDTEIEILTRWVAMGAPWPSSAPGSARAGDLFSQEDRAWWALQPIKAPMVPAANDATWAKNEIDHFILDRLESAGLTPAPPADRITLIRRLTFDLIGLPPTPQQVDAFVGDTSPAAYESLVDSLLDSPAYGEHVARQWLDLVRYADSDGYRADGYRDNAWHYRDYVIKAFNDDKPYDRFVQEQIAADELFPQDVEARAALGYLRHWVYEWNIRDAPGQWKTILEDLTDTTADVFMGLGLQCAKCHNHKFDPLLQKDYYRLQAYFAPLLPTELVLASGEELAKFEAEDRKWKADTAALRAEIETIEAPYRETLKNRAIDRFPEDIQVVVRKDVEEQTPYELQISYLVQRQVVAEYDGLEAAMKAQDKERVLELKRQLEAKKDQRPAPLDTVMAVCDVGSTAPPTTLPKRTSELILPGIPSIIDDQPANIAPTIAAPESTGRRAALAKWLTDPTNPLTTRVIVNRVWQSHFGRGLAANASDFGRLGESPTHPELLDWLTVKFVESGWSLKSLHRLILNSATYRQSTAHARYDEYQAIDPANRWYWRSNTKRLQAEQIRDAILAVTGQLKTRSGGPGALADAPTRAIYTRVMRNSPEELMGSFDLPLFFSSNASRNTTTTPVQSLLLINSDLMLGHARALAKQVSTGENGTAERVAEAWSRVYGRSPTADELQGSVEFIDGQTRRLQLLWSGQKNNGTVETAKLPYRDGQALLFGFDRPDLKLRVNSHDAFSAKDFTVESFFELRSVDKAAGVRTLVGKWDGDVAHAGWAFGITGHGSRRKPQTLVLQIVGKNADGKLKEHALFSDHHVDINTPYYAAASVRLAQPNQPGSVTFHLKDLSNDDEPVLTIEVPHEVAGGFANDLPLTIGAVSGARSRAFDGLIDDVRLVGRASPIERLLITTERSIPETIGYWRFESDPGVMVNAVGDLLHIEAQGKAIIQLEPAEAALVDFCHSLLNSNEFLYVH